MNEEMKTTTFYSECECGETLEGGAQYHPREGTLYADDDCPKCGEEFVVHGWFDMCEECDEYHPEGECE